jgi:hypothetical protein
VRNAAAKTKERVRPAGLSPIVFCQPHTAARGEGTTNPSSQTATLQAPSRPAARSPAMPMQSDYRSTSCASWGSRTSTTLAVRQ